MQIELEKGATLGNMHKLGKLARKERREGRLASSVRRRIIAMQKRTGDAR